MADTQYFFIVSQAKDPQGRPLAVSVKDNDTRVYVVTQNYQDDRQLWEKRPRSPDTPSPFALVNKKTGSVLARERADNGVPIVLRPVGDIQTNDLAVWHDDNCTGQYNALASVEHWEQKLNIPGNGPYTSGMALISHWWDDASINEMWRFFSANRVMRLTRLDFDLNAGSLDKLTPVVAQQQTIRNDTDSEQQTTLEYTGEKSKTTKFSSETGVEIGIEHTLEASMPGLVKETITMSAKASQKITFGEEQTEKETIKLSFPVKVPKRTQLNASVIMLRARIDVPYRAQFEVSYDDGTKINVVYPGVFSEVSCYDVIASFDQTEVTPVQPPTPAAQPAVPPPPPTLELTAAPQENWRWCKKCMAMHYALLPARCPLGGNHDTAGSGSYIMYGVAAAKPGQAGWRWCRKCGNMCFSGQGAGVCAAGGGHDYGGSGDYVLHSSATPQHSNHQYNWRWCSRCQSLHFAGGTGRCPATGAAHSVQGSGNYGIEHR